MPKKIKLRLSGFINGTFLIVTSVVVTFYLLSYLGSTQ
jgi:hypothetical protein